MPDEHCIQKEVPQRGTLGHITHDLLFVLFGLGDDVDGTVLDLQVGLGEVLAHNAGAEQLDAAAQQNDADHAGPAGGRVAEHQRADDDKEDADEREDRTTWS